MTSHTDVLIVGAGPAGSTLASLLARRGVQVTIVDRALFPRNKPCGETLNPGTVRLLDQLGCLSGVLAGGPAKITGWKLTTGADCSAVGRYENDRPGLGMPRRELDWLLLRRAISLGVDVHQETTVTGLQRNDDGFDVDCRARNLANKTFRTRILVGADGLRSIVSRRLGLVGRLAKLRKFSVTCRLEGLPPKTLGALHVGTDCTVGLAPVDERRWLWNGTVVLPSHVRRNDARDLIDLYRRCLSRAVSDWDERVEILDGPWTSGPFDRPVKGLYTKNALLIGDAAGYFDPLTGQGVYQALRTAQLAADAIESGLSGGTDQKHAFGSYAKQVKKEQRPTRLFQRAVDGVLSRDSLRRGSVRHLHGHGRYMDRLVRFAGDALSVRGLARLDLLTVSRGSA